MKRVDLWASHPFGTTNWNWGDEWCVWQFAEFRRREHLLPKWRHEDFTKLAPWRFTINWAWSARFAFAARPWWTK